MLRALSTSLRPRLVAALALVIVITALGGLAASPASAPIPRPDPRPTARPTPAPSSTQVVVTPAPDLSARAPAVAMPATAEQASSRRPPALRNLLQSADGSLDTPVTRYSDCTGRTPLPRASAVIDACVGPWLAAQGRAPVTYFIGHDPGVFAPLLHLEVGDIITWHDGAGAVHLFRIVSVRHDYPMWRLGAPLPSSSSVAAMFDTCEPSAVHGSLRRILEAVAA